MKPIVTDIQTEKIEELKALLSSGKFGKWEYTMTSTHRKDLIKKYAGGLCQGCDDGIPSKLVSYDVSDSEISAKRVERYCPRCFVHLRGTNGDETIGVKLGN